MIAGSSSAIREHMARISDPARYLPPAASATEASLKATASAGTSPDGVPWAPTKTGERALENAADEITVRVAGETIIVELKGNSVWWHYGTRGVAPRQVIPVRGIPLKLGQAIRAGLIAPFSGA